jgi:outer membrane protein assembly factor BamD
MKKLLTLTILALAVSSCGEYQKVVKSNDANYKFDYAQRMYQKGHYEQAASILSELTNSFRGNEKAEEVLYTLGQSYYKNKDYANSGAIFRSYYTRYPKGKYCEEARFYCGMGYVKDSPDAQLDQSTTVQAIKELSAFLEYYPKSDLMPQAQDAIFAMQDKLALKQLQNAQLYYNLGPYRGNNYESAIITAQNAVKAYPYTKYKEQLEMLILKSRYREAELSIAEKQADRYRRVVDEYYSFISNYPESSYRSEADGIYRVAQRNIKD